MAEQRPVRLGAPGDALSVSATLEVAGGQFALRPETWIERPQQITIRHSDAMNISLDVGDRPGVVADFKPRPLWGEENGEPFTVLDARMSVEEGWGLPQQVYRANVILRGAHIESEESPAEALRVAFSLSGAGWSDGDPARLEEGRGRISPWNSGHGPGLTWEPVTPHTVYGLRQRISPIPLALLRLWTGEPIGVRALEVRIEGVGWCQLESPESPPKVSAGSLLSPTQLDRGIIAHWFGLASKISPVPFSAIQDRVSQQPDALVVATALEGLHRRLHPDSQRFQLSKKQRDQARRAAVGAAVSALQGDVDEAVVREVYNEKLGYVQEPSYADRLRELLAGVEATAPGLMGPSWSGWVKDMKSIRNTQSHGLTKDDDFGEAEISRYYVLASSGRWVLKIRLLLELVDRDTLRSALWRSDRFMFALANIDREHYWPGFSAHDHFSAAARGAID